MKNSYDSVPDRHLDNVMAARAERKRESIKTGLASLGVIAAVGAGIVGMEKLGANFNDPAGPTFNNSGNHGEVNSLSNDQFELPEQYDGQVKFEQSSQK